MRGEILVGVERRRRWSADQNLSILAEVGVNRATVTQVAQRHEITRQQIYAWRHKMRREMDLGNTGPVTFLPVELGERDATHTPSTIVSEAKAVDIILPNGRRVRFEAEADDGAVMRAIRIAEVA
ncbi:MAG: transposase [Rhodobacterales bacterium]|jgi:transposase